MMANHYEAKLRRVIDYIHNHLDEDLNLDHLAQVACLSPYHWHRIYSGIFGESIITTVKRLRLHRAAGYLAHSDYSIEEIAKKTGYNNLQSFTRIFKDQYGLPPAQFRKQGSHTQFQLDKEELHKMFDVSLKSIADIHLVTIPHKGSYMEIGRAFDQLYGMLGAKGMFQPGMRAIGIYYDDPGTVAEADLRSCAGISVDPVFNTEDLQGVERITIDGGDYAVLNYKGPYTDMMGAYNWFFGDWLVNSGKQAGDKPVFEEYLNNPREAAPADLLTDIYMPLA